MEFDSGLHYTSIAMAESDSRSGSIMNFVTGGKVKMNICVYSLPQDNKEYVKTFFSLTPALDLTAFPTSGWCSVYKLTVCLSAYAYTARVVLLFTVCVWVWGGVRWNGWI